MNNFCEECGHQLGKDNIFCEECGTSVSQSNTPENIPPRPQASKEEGLSGFSLHFNFFREKNWTSQADKTDCIFGIILTNFSAFSEKWGAEKSHTLRNELNNYAEGMKQFGLYYLVLDVSDTFLTRKISGSWQDHVNLLRTAIKHAKKKLKDDIRFVMIFGGHEIIPMAVFENPMEGLDPDLDSDTPYSSLSIYHPFKKKDAATLKLAVGRMPTGPDTQPSDLLSLMQNTLDAMADFPLNKTFSLSCLNWQIPSSVVSSQVTTGKLNLSPSVTLNNLPNYYTADVNLHYFNLHGCDGKRAATWVGQNEYPQQHPQCEMDHAFSPSAIAANRVLNVVGVEACYGAKFIDIEKNYSILLSAMGNKTVSFTGASRIAIGPPNKPEINDADIIIRDYLAHLKNEVPAGYALLNAKNHVLEKNIKHRAAEAFLSFIEFNLFGDPAFMIFSNEKKGMPPHKNITTKGFIAPHDLETQGHSEETKDTVSGREDSVYTRVSREVDRVNEKIVALINKNVWAGYPEFKDIQPTAKRYQYEGKSFNSLSYKREGKLFDSYLVVSADDGGDIIQVSQSK